MVNFTKNEFGNVVELSPQEWRTLKDIFLVIQEKNCIDACFAEALIMSSMRDTEAFEWFENISLLDNFPQQWQRSDINKLWSIANGLVESRAIEKLTPLQSQLVRILYEDIILS